MRWSPISLQLELEVQPRHYKAFCTLLSGRLSLSISEPIVSALGSALSSFCICASWLGVVVPRLADDVAVPVRSTAAPLDRVWPVRL
jgi:hypothetical protein